MRDIYDRLAKVAEGWEQAATDNPFTDLGMAAEVLLEALDHPPVSVSGWYCDICGRTVNGQTDEDGRPVQQGDSVRHVGGSKP